MNWPAVVTTGQVIRCCEQDGYSDRLKEKRTERTRTKEDKNCETLLKFWQHIPVDAVMLAACDQHHERRKKNSQLLLAKILLTTKDAQSPERENRR